MKIDSIVPFAGLGASSSRPRKDPHWPTRLGAPDLFEETEEPLRGWSGEIPFENVRVGDYTVAITIFRVPLRYETTPALLRIRHPLVKPFLCGWLGNRRRERPPFE